LLGQYFTETIADGKHSFHMKVTIKAPQVISDKNTRGMWLIGSTEEGIEEDSIAEVFGCEWGSGVQQGACQSSIG
jgi:hypothetical protein